LSLRQYQNWRANLNRLVKFRHFTVIESNASARPIAVYATAVNIDLTAQWGLLWRQLSRIYSFNYRFEHFTRDQALVKTAAGIGTIRVIYSKR
jgi:hypothetical protein